MIFHPLNIQIDKPLIFNNPFYYQADELCKYAQKEVLKYLKTRTDFLPEIEQGKMFGVLIAEKAGETGFLAAYSGQILGGEDHDYFVPAVYNYLETNGYFKVHEKEISDINQEIADMEISEEYTKCKLELAQIERERDNKIAEYQNFMREEKIKRDEARKSLKNNEEEKKHLIKQSQFQKAELKRLKEFYKAKITNCQQKIIEFSNGIESLKSSRKKKSDLLQNWLFSKFEMLNFKGEKKNLLEIFRNFGQIIPPAGSGECCAPKLLQYAYNQNFKPISIAEFWYGNSPKGEIRKHLNFYPACNSKCKPILNFMLQGLNVADNPLIIKQKQELEYVYDDEYLCVVNKPAGMLSVPGKNDRESVYSIVRQKFREAEEPMVCHRLDMATSGLMIIAKRRKVYENIQKQFETHTIKKTYVAILDGIVNKAEGKISLPLMPDLNDRPRQIVNFDYGKESITEFKVLKTENGKTWIEFQPQTGRTHQLRVHSAHNSGLATPILGDELYGKKSDRMYLHALKIRFIHPISGETMTFEKKPNW